MNTFAAILVVAVVAAVVSSAPPKYPTKYDNLNIDNILTNERVLTSYINCILDKGPCTSEGREFRKRVPEAIESACERCTDGQKKMIRKAAKHIMDNRRAEWEQIKKKYDPKGLHVDTFNRFMEDECVAFDEEATLADVELPRTDGRHSEDSLEGMDRLQRRITGRKDSSSKRRGGADCRATASRVH